MTARGVISVLKTPLSMRRCPIRTTYQARPPPRRIAGCSLVSPGTRNMPNKPFMRGGKIWNGEYETGKTEESEVWKQKTKDLNATAT